MASTMNRDSVGSDRSSSKAFVTPPEGAEPMGDPVLDLEQVDADLSFRAVEAVGVRVEQLDVDIDVSPSKFSLAGLKSRGPTEYKPILKKVNARMPGGTVTAILGSSGSGKTSVLNTLSHRIEGGKLRTHGRILYNDQAKLSDIRSAYVMQQDVLLPSLTVRETLRYAAELRLPPPTTQEERLKVVEDVILELGLKECADTRVGNNVHKGCSGGEKRRTSLAVQMLANPSVLFLDEVTTGLDATTAFQLMGTLKSLARKGRTVIITIHQPRSEIWSLFDHVLLLANGSPLYSGSAHECLPYFAQIGYELPAFSNPAEYLIDIAAIDNRTPEAEAESTHRVQGLIKAWETHLEHAESRKKRALADCRDENIIVQSAAPDSETAAASHQSHAGFVRQVKVLTKRTFKVTWRDPYGMAGSIFEATIMSIISGWIFYQLDESLQGIRSREGGLFISSSLQSYLVSIFFPMRLTGLGALREIRPFVSI